MTLDGSSDAILRALCAEPESVELTSEGVRLTLSISEIPQLTPDACALLLTDSALRTALVRAYGSDRACTPLQKNVTVVAPWTTGILAVEGRLLKTGRRLAVGEVRITLAEQVVAHVTATYRIS